MATRMWMVRGDSGRLYEAFRADGIVAVGWHELVDVAKAGVTREALVRAYAQRRPDLKPGTIQAGASQVWRFINEIKRGDRVITYDPSARRYLVGTVTGDVTVDENPREAGLSILRTAQWDHEFERDRLSVPAKNTLGSTLTLFLVAANVADEVLRVAQTKATVPSAEVAEPASEDAADDDQLLFEDVREKATEFIKDRISRLDWKEMQRLIAGILRAMGYKTRISKEGSDRGVDIIASPDGLGFENPRIVVEVKHRAGQMTSKEIRSFLGGRHKDDRGLYVSSGGFTKDARYEADRGSIPLTLWESGDVVEALVEYYDKLDSETRLLMPLKRVYWPG